MAVTLISSVLQKNRIFVTLWFELAFTILRVVQTICLDNKDSLNFNSRTQTDLFDFLIWLLI